MYLLFDIGGSKMRLAISADGQSFAAPVIVATPQTAEEVVALFKIESDKLLAGQLPSFVCGGLTRKRLAAAPGIQALFTCPVLIENDTALVGLGECLAGAGAGAENLAYLTVSTGVGGVRIVKGKIAEAAEGFEPGHQIIDWQVPTKHLEDYISGTAVEAATGKPPRETVDPEFWRDLAKIFAVGLHNTILHWSPEVVVLGGSMFKVPGLVVADVAAELAAISHVFTKLPELRAATLGDFGGLHGALGLARQKNTA